MSFTCAFTGPRPHNLPFLLYDDHPAYLSLRQRLQKEITLLCEQGVTDFYCGMALGCDLLFAELVLELKKAYRINLHAVLPYRRHTADWDPANQERCANLLKQCDNTTCLHENYQPDCYIERNHYMVDRADILLAVCDPDHLPQRSGTGATVRYARRNDKRIYCIPPAAVL